MSEMEPEIKEFLAKIATSLSLGLLWLLVNCTIGIAFNFAFFDKQPTIGNYIFYVWFLASFIWLIRYYRRKWKL